jgi:hypothetical protein
VIRSIVEDLEVASADAQGSECIADRAILLAEAARIPGARISNQKIAALLARTMEQASQDPGSPTLFGGFLGLGFAVECLRALGQRGLRGSGQLDRFLLRSLSVPLPPESEFDLINGVVGAGVYLLARLPRITARRALEQLVRRLEERAEPSGRGLAWRTPPKAPRRGQIPGRVFDLGLAHGIAGIVALLAKLRVHGISPRRTHTLLRGGVNWLFDQRLDRHNLQFPAFAAERTEPKPTRAAWCYGDPGVSIAVFSAARALGDRKAAAEALDIARKVAGLSLKQSGTRDACLCHGSAGMAQIFNRLYQATGDEAMREAASAWLVRALESRRAPGGAAGFLFWGSPQPASDLPGDFWADRTLLTGSLGVGLALASACSEAPPVWDRMLLLDVS